MYVSNYPLKKLINLQANVKGPENSSVGRGQIWHVKLKFDLSTSQPPLAALEQHHL